MKSRLTIAFALFCAGSTIGYAGESESTNLDWHQWRGVNRDGVSRETGVLKNWTNVGPKVLWQIPLGDGFSGVSIADGRAYTVYAKGEDEIVVCLDATNGKEIWRYVIDERFRSPDGGDGPRSTPTIDGDTVYALSAHGRLVALDAQNRKALWHCDFRSAFSSEQPRYGFCTSAIVQGDLLLLQTGGTRDNALVAFDKHSGKIVWSCEDDPCGYSSPITVTISGKRQTVFFTGRGLVSVSPKTGTVYWRYDWQTPSNINAATPIFIPPNRIFMSSGYDIGAAVVQIKEIDGKLVATTVWKSRVMKNHFSSSIYQNGYLYGFDNAVLKCINAETGREQWITRGFGRGTLIYADGCLIILGENGNLALAKATPTEYEQLAETQLLKGRCWTLPTLSGGKLYLRNMEELVCVDLSARRRE